MRSPEKSTARRESRVWSVSLPLSRRSASALTTEFQIVTPCSAMACDIFFGNAE